MAFWFCVKREEHRSPCRRQLRCAVRAGHARRSIRHPSPAFRSHAHARHHARLSSESPQAPARENYRSGISRGWAERQFAFTHSLGGVAEGFANIFELQVRIGHKNLFPRHPLCHHSNHGSDGNPQAPDTRNPTHLAWIDGDSAKPHCLLFYHTADCNSQLSPWDLRRRALMPFMVASDAHLPATARQTHLPKLGAWSPDHFQLAASPGNTRS